MYLVANAREIYHATKIQCSEILNAGKPETVLTLAVISA